MSRCQFVNFPVPSKYCTHNWMVIQMIFLLLLLYNMFLVKDANMFLVKDAL